MKKSNENPFVLREALRVVFAAKCGNIGRPQLAGICGSEIKVLRSCGYANESYICEIQGMKYKIPLKLSGSFGIYDPLPQARVHTLHKPKRRSHAE